MPHVISFETAMFDLRQEPKNPINPIGGYSALAWLRTALASRLELTEPDCEDWGWYSTATFQGCGYLVGACAVGEPGDDPLEWLIQIHKQRSLGDKLRGRNRLTPDDPLSSLIHTAVRGEPAFRKVELRVE